MTLFGDRSVAQQGTDLVPHEALLRVDLLEPRDERRVRLDLRPRVAELAFRSDATSCVFLFHGGDENATFSTMCEEGAPSTAAAWRYEYPAFVKRPPDDSATAVLLELDLTSLPETLRPRVTTPLPLDFDDEGFKRNLELRPDEKHPSLLEAIPGIFKDYYLAPHVVYTPVLYLLLTRVSQQSRVRATTTVFDLYQFYRCVNFMFQHHPLVVNGIWTARHR